MKKNTKLLKKSIIIKKKEKSKLNESENIQATDLGNNKRGFPEEDFTQREDPPSTDHEKKVSSNRLPFEFFDSPCEVLAKKLLGKTLCRMLEDGTVLKGKIVETESYLGFIDKASTTYQGKVTARNIPMYMSPGTIFVYLTYGMYHCFNISSQGDGSSVFLRAVEPQEGIEKMREFRNSKLKNSKKELKLNDICNGPSKLCIAFDIKKEFTKYSVCSWKGLWIEDGNDKEDFKIVECPRIGIESAGKEWAEKPLRFYILDNQFVSKRNKDAELKA